MCVYGKGCLFTAEPRVIEWFCYTRTYVLESTNPGLLFRQFSAHYSQQSNMIPALEKEISGSTTEAEGNLHVEGKELRRCQVTLHFSQSGVSVCHTKWSCETKTPLAMDLQTLDTNPRIERSHVL